MHLLQISHVALWDGKSQNIYMQHCSYGLTSGVHFLPKIVDISVCSEHISKNDPFCFWVGALQIDRLTSGVHLHDGDMVVITHMQGYNKQTHTHTHM